jgi:hypothetical protein
MSLRLLLSANLDIVPGIYCGMELLVHYGGSCREKMIPPPANISLLNLQPISIHQISVSVSIWPSRYKALFIVMFSEG